MIECESCKRYFHADDIEKCPNCGMELCEECFQSHVPRCLNPELFEDDEEEESSIPHICPECGEELKLDIDSEESMRVICSNPDCDYQQQLTQEQIDELGTEDDEEVEDEE